MTEAQIEALRILSNRCEILETLFENTQRAITATEKLMGCELEGLIAWTWKGMSFQLYQVVEAIGVLEDFSA